MNSRRKFIISSILLPVAAVASYQLLSSKLSQYPALQKVLSRVKPVLREKLGSRYAKQYPQENTDWLIGHFITRFEITSATSSEELEKAFETAVNNDFTHTEIVSLHGWQLGKEEARLLALAKWIES